MLWSCQEVCRKIASDELAGAGLRERMIVRFHLWRCGDCSRYEEQLRTISTSMRALAHEEGSAPPALARLEQSILDASSAGSSRHADDIEE